MYGTKRSAPGIGRPLSIKASQVYQQDGDMGRAKLQKSKDRTYTVLSKGEIAKALARLKNQEAKIVRGLEKKGIPAGEIVAGLRGN